MYNIAIVDDSDIARISLRMYLKNAGYNTTIEAKDGLDIIEKLSNSNTLPHICFMDIEMPNMNGYEATKKIISKWPEIIIIAYSNSYSQDTIIKVLRSGAVGYIKKGDELSEINAAIIGLMSKGYYMGDKTCKELLKYFRAMK